MTVRFECTTHAAIPLRELFDRSRSSMNRSKDLSAGFGMSMNSAKMRPEL